MLESKLIQEQLSNVEEVCPTTNTRPFYVLKYHTNRTPVSPKDIQLDSKQYQLITL